MREKGISPPHEGDIVNEFFLLTWLRRLQQVFPKVETYTVSLTPASVAANTSAEETYTLSGLNNQDLVLVNPPSATAGLGLAGARVSADNTLALTWLNATGGALSPPSGTYRVVSVRL